MPNRSRTYKPSDWQVWIYTPVAGKFRLDFSLLNGANVLGAVGDIGSMTKQNIKISSINLVDSTDVSQGVFGTITPASAFIVINQSGISKTMLDEYYVGKKIAVTLKNEATTGPDSIYGYNTVYFVGFIQSVSVDIDPLNSFSTITLNATDYLAGLLNQPVTFTQSTTNNKSSLLVDPNFLAAAYGAGSIFQDSITIPYSQWNDNLTYTKSLGEWLQDFIDSGVVMPITKRYSTLDGSYRVIYLYTIGVVPGVSGTLDVTKIISYTFETDGDQIPTYFNYENGSGSTYVLGIPQSGTLSNPIVDKRLITVKDTTQLTAIANKIQEFEPQLRPIAIQTIQAMPNQQIIFLDASGGPLSFLQPKNSFSNGDSLQVNLSEYGYLATEEFTIIGQNHEITTDYWKTTFNVTKGL